MSVLSKLEETLICLKAGRVTLAYPAQAEATAWPAKERCTPGLRCDEVRGLRGVRE